MSSETSSDRRRFLSVSALTVLASLPWGLLRSSTLKSPSEGDLPSFRGATGWINSAAIERNNLRGRVVLVNFWTYSCINARRALPWLRAWNQKYREHGLTVIGVHSPEFPFEKDMDNVRRAAKEMLIEFPIAIDNDYAIWQAFNNQFWPALYFVDARGKIRHHQFGEGGYGGSEQVIQELLSDSGATGFDRSLVSVDAEGPELPADLADLLSNENYLGNQRTENFESPGGAAFNKPHSFNAPVKLKLNHWALSGNWTSTKQSVSLNASGGRIAYQFHARDLHLVMGAAERNAKIRFRVSIDGQTPGAAHGVDVDAGGNGTVDEPRMYQLVRQSAPIVDRRFEIEFLDSGLQAYSFTFG